MKYKEEITIDDLYEAVSKYIKSEKEIAVIKEAYELAYKHHKGIFRLTGDEYIAHPIAVAYILTDTKADYETISAALLHDVVEDSSVTTEEIEEQFGKNIARLVDGVTKINRLSFRGDGDLVIANHRKILVGLTEDVRVIIIKFADRLHNMRSFWVHSEEKSKRKAKETLDILVPIASRLGMSKMKMELEDLSLRYYKPDVYFSIVEQINETKMERNSKIDQMIKDLSEVLTNEGINNKVVGRVKSIYSIYKKLDTGRGYNDIYDFLALRVFVDTPNECYQALGMIHSKYRPLPHRFKDYVSRPKTNMYQSIHTTVFDNSGDLYEIQIRTQDMDDIAENGIASHWSYKEHGSVKAEMQNVMEQKLQFFKSIIDLRDEVDSNQDFVDTVKSDVFNNTIYIFTPNGDVIEMPKGSTPIDFAYRIHTGVGNTMIGAMANGHIVPLDYEMKNNDVIKINTNKSSLGPSREWIDIAYTSSARNRIRAFYSKQDKDGNIKNGEDLLNRELRKLKFSATDFKKDANLEKLFKEFKVGSFEELCILVFNERVAVRELVDVISGTEESGEDKLLSKLTKQVVKEEIKKDIIVAGIDEIKVSLAKCCNPVPQDRIVGYITKGEGITVHRMVCPNISSLSERLIDVIWNEETTLKYQTNILIHTNNTDNIMMDIVSMSGGSNVMIKTIDSAVKGNSTIYKLTIIVSSKNDVMKFIAAIKELTSVADVDRVIK